MEINDIFMLRKTKMGLIILTIINLLLQSAFSFKLLLKFSKNNNMNMNMISTDSNTYFSKFSIKQWGLFDEVIILNKTQIIKILIIIQIMIIIIIV